MAMRESSGCWCYQGEIMYVVWYEYLCCFFLLFELVGINIEGRCARVPLLTRFSLKSVTVNREYFVSEIFHAIKFRVK